MALAMSFCLFWVLKTMWKWCLVKVWDIFCVAPAGAHHLNLPLFPGLTAWATVMTGLRALRKVLVHGPDHQSRIARSISQVSADLESCAAPAGALPLDFTGSQA